MAVTNWKKPGTVSGASVNTCPLRLLLEGNLLINPLTTLNVSLKMGSGTAVSDSYRLVCCDMLRRFGFRGLAPTFNFALFVALVMWGSKPRLIAHLQEV